MKTYKFAPIEARARTVAIWLIVSMISHTVSVALAVFDLRMLSRLEILTQADVALWDMTPLARIPLVLIYVINIVLICFWVYRAAANAHALRKGLRTSPPWAVGWYFIPIASLWKPFLVMKDIWRASFSRQAGNPAPSDHVLGGWWAFWIVTGISGNISYRITVNATDAPTFVVSAWFAILSGITGFLAAWSLRRIVLRISSAQTVSHAYLVAASEELARVEAIEVAPR